MGLSSGSSRTLGRMKMCCECRSPLACQENGCFVGLINILPAVDPGQPERKRTFRRRQRGYRKLKREQRVQREQ